jgi:hypothetical protein
MRFDMARALIKRAEARQAWIGDDHGDPYEEALNTEVIPIEMEIALKEILDHLRSALDYCARQVCEACGPVPPGVNVYFPIVARGFDVKDFPSRVGKLMPGVMKSRPDLVPVLARFQPFSAEENGWLADLATLANETKHEQLSVNAVSAQDITISFEGEGKFLVKAHSERGRAYLRPSLKRIKLANDGLYGDGQMLYLHLKRIDEELLYFLRTAVSGVSKIIDTLEEALTESQPGAQG